MKCKCRCEDNNEEVYPFICPDCKGFYDCDVVINGLCVCPECEKDIYTNNQADRLRRVDTSNSEAIVGSANIDEIAELNRND